MRGNTVKGKNRQEMSQMLNAKGKMLQGDERLCNKEEE